MNIRRFIGKFTSPIFVPLRRFVAWADQSFGTCDHRLVVVPVMNCALNLPEPEPEKVIPKKASELEVKLSKDKANMRTWDTSEDSYPEMEFLYEMEV
tara:strand:+ start:1423 stop:1713 length:291 start_codon:yes stop_codon:yes gene_type:complete